jgi:hypothetical protein
VGSHLALAIDCVGTLDDSWSVKSLVVGLASQKFGECERALNVEKHEGPGWRNW